MPHEAVHDPLPDPAISSVALVVIIAPPDLTAAAKAAIANLDDEHRIPKMLAVGKAIADAKAALPHGSLTKWYKNELGRSESWCSLYWRLHNDRTLIDEALDWAERIKHKSAHGYAIEQLLSLIREYKVKVVGVGATGDIPERPALPGKAKSKAGLAQLVEHFLAAAEPELEALRLDLETAPSIGNGSANELLLALAKRFGQFLHACRGLQEAAGFSPTS